MLRRNVLIFHSGALGDFVLTWPVAMGVGRILAQSRVFYVTQGEKGRLAERVLGVEAKDVEGGWQHLFGDATKLPEPVRRTLEGARLVINFVAAENNDWVRNVKEISRGADVLTAVPRPPDGYGRPVSDFLLDQLKSQPVLQAAVAQMIRSVREKGAGVLWKGGDTVLLHPGSGSRTKCWPVSKWVDLATRLIKSGQRVRIITGEVEEERFTADEKKSLHRAAEVHALSTYSQLLDELAAARAFVGNDSGPGHMAATIGVPTVSLFATTDPVVWAPIGPRITIIRGQGMDGIGVNEVLAATRNAARARTSTAEQTTPPDDE